MKHQLEVLRSQLMALTQRHTSFPMMYIVVCILTTSESSDPWLLQLL